VITLLGTIKRKNKAIRSLTGQVLIDGPSRQQPQGASFHSPIRERIRQIAPATMKTSKSNLVGRKNDR
jgi:hypothetical protein